MELSSASAQQFEVKAIAEKKIPQLPSGQLFWCIDTLPTLTQAQSRMNAVLKSNVEAHNRQGPKP